MAIDCASPTFSNSRLWSFLAICLVSLVVFAPDKKLTAQTAIGSGLNATEGNSIAPNTSAPFTDTLWADSGNQRWMMNNHNLGGQLVAFWPCGARYGCILYSGTVISGINTEQGLSYPSGGTGFFLQSGTQSGNNGPVWSSYTLPSSLGTTGGLLYGSSSTVVSQSSAATLGSTGALTIAQGSLTSSTPVFNHSATWNSGATTFTNIFSNITNTSSAAASKLIDLQVGGSSKFNVDEAGNPTAVGQLTLGANGGSTGQITFDGSSSGNATLTASSTAATLTSSVTVVAPKLTINSNGGHIQTNLATSDIAGSISLSAATSGSQTFATPYSNAPICVITPTTNPAMKSFWVTTSTTVITANISTSATIIFNYVCIGNPN